MVQNSCGAADLERIALSWPAYVTHVRQRLGCRVLLLAFCPDEPTDRKVATPIDTGHISKCVPARYRKEWERLVAMAIENYHWESDFALEHQAIGRAEGKAEGKAEALAGSVLRALEKRGLEVSDEVRGRVSMCSDLDQLTQWFDLALVVDSAEQIFQSGTGPAE